MSRLRECEEGCSTKCSDRPGSEYFECVGECMRVCLTSATGEP